MHLFHFYVEKKWHIYILYLYNILFSIFTNSIYHIHTYALNTAASVDVVLDSFMSMIILAVCFASQPNELRVANSYGLHMPLAICSYLSVAPSVCQCFGWGVSLSASLPAACLPACFSVPNPIEQISHI